MGFILYNKNKKAAHIDDFGPYFIEQVHTFVRCIPVLDITRK